MPAALPPSRSRPTLASLAQAAKAQKDPPLAQWNPTETADSHILITADGTWLHEGREIPRLEMVQAFAKLLMKDPDGQHWLITPECRQRVAVEDTAFVAIDLQKDGENLLFRLNTGEWIAAGPDTPLVVTEKEGQPYACLHVAHGCEARLNRSTWLQLVETALARDTSFVSSGGVPFALETPA